jgi:hypothetical protein
MDHVGSIWAEGNRRFVVGDRMGGSTSMPTSASSETAHATSPRACDRLKASGRAAKSAATRGLPDGVASKRQASGDTAWRCDSRRRRSACATA